MLKVTVVSTAIRNMKGVGKTSGKPYDMNFQTVYLHTVGKEALPPPSLKKPKSFSKKPKTVPCCFTRLASTPCTPPASTWATRAIPKWLFG